MRLSLILSTSLLALCMPLHAAPQTFDLTDPKKVNHIAFHLDAPLEAISGMANDVRGEVHFDPANPSSVRGRVIAPVAKMTVPNDQMQRALHGERWLQAEKHPEITFEVTAAKLAAESTADRSQLLVTGQLQIRGVSREVTAPLTLAYLPGRLAERSGPGMPLPPGDLLILRSRFTVKLSDYGIDRGPSALRVSDEVELTFSLAAMAPKPTAPL
jgi:polyisoprenoid-binding protein YceI